ncbi:MAG: hypothetical protein M0R80_10650 [Proteobacteria bacterium]|jgi:hypothetical protein|nr:hypothetical protein [Pseudomonadota bacterium]
MRSIVAALAIAVALLGAWPSTAHSWTLDGGAPWKGRVGPGLYAAIGGVACGEDDFCNDHHAWDSRLFGSLDGIVGFQFRVIPNLVIFFDLSTALLPSSRDHYDHDRGFLFRTVGGAEFHVPILGWLEAYAGFGIGFAFLRFRGELDTENDQLVKETLMGVDFELRTGATVYLFSKAPGLGFGPYYRAGLVYWPTYCHEVEGDGDCEEVDDYDFDQHDLPFLHHVGIELRYVF